VPAPITTVHGTTAPPETGATTRRIDPNAATAAAQQALAPPGLLDRVLELGSGIVSSARDYLSGDTSEVPRTADTSDFSKGERITSTNEGYSATPYIDSEGFWTVGYGELVLKNKKPFKASDADIKKWGGKRSGQPPPPDIIKQRFTGLLARYLGKSKKDHRETFRTNYTKYRTIAKKAVGLTKWKDLSDAWQNELSDLAYQLGKTRFLKFDKMLKALKEAGPHNNRMEDAEYEFLSSIRAIEQTPRRAYHGFQRIREESPSSQIRTNAQAKEFVLDALSAYRRNNAR